MTALGIDELLSRFRVATEAEIAAAEFTLGHGPRGAEERHLFYALRVSHCVPRLVKLTTLGSRWNVANAGAGGAGLAAAVASPAHERVRRFLEALYLERFDELVAARVREAELRLIDGARGAARVFERTRADIEAGRDSFRHELPGLVASAQRWIDALAQIAAGSEFMDDAPASDEAPAEKERSVPFVVDVQHASVVCFALEQVGAPIIGGVRIRNAGVSPRSGWTLEVALAPDFAASVTAPVPDCAGGDEVALGPLDMRLPPGRLRGLVEAERARIVWILRDGSEVLVESGADVEVLAHNEWPGARGPAALLATFVMPNHPVVGRILQRVRDRLLADTGDGGISGYQSRSPKRVLEHVRALYATVQDLGITYVGVPASFERTGQKIRLPDVILEGRMGNCLDLSLLYAACLEQMGLAPLIVLVQGHAFPGVWLVDERFPEVVVPDAARIRTQVELQQIVCFDSSTGVDASHPPLEVAVAEARRRIDDDARFGWAVDVRAARTDRYRPLSIRMESERSETGGELRAGGDLARMILHESLVVPDAIEEPRVPPPPETVVARFKAWKDKLLDLTLHNRLLNFRPGAGQSITLEVADAAAFEDALASKQRLQILPRPRRDSQDERSSELTRARGDDQRRSELEADLRSKRVHATYTEGDLFARARELARQAKTDREEGGVNTTFAAIGMLKWYESDSSEMPRYSPLLLVPVELEYETRTQRVLLSAREEESVGNVTLAEKMARDWSVDLSVLASFSADESGVDVPALLRAVRTGIQRMPRWEVLEDVHVGHFTFAKFLMWKDLEDNSAVLLENPVVRHIAEGGKKEFADPIGDVRPEELDDTVAPVELPAVMDADSTQLAAVTAGLRGRSFVLEGPPGTGKSQTITNLIAACLARGKSVLFVSEKMAALEVVHRRLDQVGLGDFCLELHSNKANKKQVVESLHRAYARTKSATVDGWEQRCARLQELRTRLNEHARALHRPRPLGENLYRASARVLELRAQPRLELPARDLSATTRDDYRTWLELADGLAVAARRIEPVSAHPWRASELAEWSAGAQDVIAACLASTIRATDEARAVAGELGAMCGMDAPPNLSELAAMVAASTCAVSGSVPRAAWNDRTWGEADARCRAYLALHDDDERERADVARRWQDAVLDRDVAPLHAAYAENAGKSGWLAWWPLRGPKAQLRQLVRGELGGRAAIEQDLATVLRIRRRAKTLEAARAEVVSLVGPAWSGTRSVDGLRALLERSGSACAAGASLRAARLLLSEAFLARAESAAFPDTLDAVSRRARAASGAFAAATGELTSAARVGSAMPASDHVAQFAEVRAAAAAWALTLPTLRDWCGYAKACMRVDAVDLHALVAAHRTGGVAAHDLRTALEHGFLSRWVVAVRDQEPALREFSGDQHDDLVERFRVEDRAHTQLSRSVVQAQVDGRRPAMLAAPSSGSEASILLGQVRLQRAHMAIRKLFDKIPNLLPRLKPCMLMSPLSVAQYLPADGRRFDLVIFDEASQIGTHDAIGAIGRGDQVIVVGDSRQLPPTTFFQRNLDTDELPDENDVTELESVLDEACRVRLPRQWLGWHYRSRHESLIDFSNRHYYDNRLEIYASARWRSNDLGVHWRHVPDGVYELGKTRTNPREAERLVADLVATLRETAPGARTFGIVTFSAQQQTEVEDRLDRARVQFPEIDAHFAGTLLEPVFVKNLENVQGDERDEIFLSVCYGPDEKGRTSMNFGPLNRTGGERRLNVAITRARRALRVYSTMRHDQIDLARTNSVGARHLRAFLQYAAEQSASAAQGRPTTRTFDSEFERQVHDALRLAGYDVDTQVGCAGYRIDLAVRHPKMPGVYALGIECDGAPYHSAATARDRDRLRQQVLEGLHWRLHRVWSTDWWFDRERETSRLIAAVARAVEREDAVERVSAPLAVHEVAIPYTSIPSSAQVAASPAAVDGPPTTAYRHAVLPSKEGLDIHSVSSHRALRECIEIVVGTEGPVHVDDLIERVAGSFGVGRITERVRGSVLAVVGRMTGESAIAARDEFLWLRAADVAVIRTPAPGDEPRDVERIAIEELAAASRWHLQHSLSLPVRELSRATIRTFGLGSLGRRAEARMAIVTARLMRDGHARLDGDHIEWAGA